MAIVMQRKREEVRVEAEDFATAWALVPPLTAPVGAATDAVPVPRRTVEPARAPKPTEPWSASE